jgi:endo-1,4-beta-xylanase
MLYPGDMMRLTRRGFLSALAISPLQPHAEARPGPSLRDLAAARHIRFGTALTCADIALVSYARLVVQQCAIITPGIEAKWASVEPHENEFSFGPMDRIAAYAADGGLALHMHNLIWAVGLPRWAIDRLAHGDGRTMMRHHIATTAGRYRGQCTSWDVVNEPIDPRWPADRNGLCTTPWRLGLGPDYILQALTDAHEADPTAHLMINDDDLEYDAPDREQKRMSYLRLIESLLRRGAPLHGFGLEAHIKPWLPIADAPYRRFLRELAGFGLKLHITEFDINDRTLAADIAARDLAVAGITRRFLDLALDEQAVKTLITWGLSDRATWMLHDPSARRADGLPPRPLPYDEHLQPKPMRAAIAAALRAAPART